jgi:hypothetical protein
MEFLEGGGGEGTFFQRRFPLGTNQEKSFPPHLFSKNLKKGIRKAA